MMCVQFTRILKINLMYRLRPSSFRSAPGDYLLFPYPAPPIYLPSLPLSSGPPGYPRLVFLRLGRTSPPKITPGGVTTNI